MRADEKLLDEIHGLVAGSIKEELARAREAKDEDGKPKPIPSSLILAAMKFLKDNGIDAPARSQRMSSLADELESIDLDQAAAQRIN